MKKQCKVSIGGCGEYFDIDNFRYDNHYKDNHINLCTTCERKKFTKYNNRRKSGIVKVDNNKSRRYCHKCLETKLQSEFSNGQPYCRECMQSEVTRLYTPEEKPVCCGKVLESDALGTSGQGMKNQPRVWMCNGCGKVLGLVDDQLTPEKVLMAMSNPTGERWDRISTNRG